jgi:hypothetical protein
MESNIKFILQLMNEQVGQYGINTGNIIDPMMDQSGSMSSDGFDPFDTDELKIAARYIQLIGCPDRARELLDKVTEASEVLNADGLDDAVIDEISNVMPDEV